MSALATSSSFHFGSFLRNLMARMWRWVRIAAYSVARAARFMWRWTAFGVVKVWSGVRCAYSWMSGLFTKKA